MSFNPYANDDRFVVKASKDYETQKKEAEENAKKIDHPLMEGKKLDMSMGELKTFTKAMQENEF